MRSTTCFGMCVAAAALSALAGAAAGQGLQQVPAGTPQPAAAPVKQLVPGDPAPPLVIKEWVKGKPVTKFEKGKVYMVEFWATWCGPCRASIPKLSEIQAKYGDKGVTVIGVSIDQQGMEAVKPFMEKTGKRMEYTIALDEGGTAKGYMAATNVGGIPHAYIIDKDGKLAWHGHPADTVELVLGEVCEGKFDFKKHEERMLKFREADGRFSVAKEARNWDDCEKILDEITVMRPDLANNLLVTRYWIKSSGRGDLPAAIAYAHKVADGDLKSDGEMTMMLASQVVATPGLMPAEQEYGTTLAKRAVDLTKGKNPAAYSILSDALKKDGKFDEAIEAGQKALAASDEELEKRYYTDRLDEVKKAKAEAEKPAETKPAAKP